MTTTKDREDFDAQIRQKREAARADFGDRCVSDVLLKAHTRLRMLSDLCYGMVGNDCSQMSSSGWVGLSDTLDEIQRDIAMLEDALPADAANWRPGEDAAQS